ncbi:MAG: tryptophan synthase subunit alpha, partial [Planctomycetaceae bacterium]|nr:tryptophan synthase subunit alpha [Planctomycetaceae bacterium]
MDFLQRTFERTRQEKRAAIVGYITAGDPDVERSFEIIDAACANGLDVLELGIPFSDPMADGVVIQKASGRAIKAGMTLAKGLEIVRELRKRHDLPIILFSYFNPIFIFGVEKFVREALGAGVDGVLVVDLPAENAAELMQHVIPKPVWAVGFAHEQPLRDVTLACSASGISKQLGHNHNNSNNDVTKNAEITTSPRGQFHF